MSADSVKQSEALGLVSQDFRSMSTYFISLLTASYLLPTLARNLITFFRLDRKGRRLGGLFRFHGAPWYYLLSGSDFPKDKQPDFIAISAIVDIAGTAFLFTGILNEYYVDADGVLDRLVLEDVMRRPIVNDKLLTPTVDDPARFYSIDGDYFVLRYSEAITLNVEYIKLEVVEETVPGVDTDATKAGELA